MVDPVLYCKHLLAIFHFKLYQAIPFRKKIFSYAKFVLCPVYCMPSWTHFEITMTIKFCFNDEEMIAFNGSKSTTWSLIPGNTFSSQCERFNPLSASVALISRPVNWFAEQINRHFYMRATLALYGLIWSWNFDQQLWGFGYWRWML